MAEIDLGGDSSSQLGLNHRTGNNARLVERAIAAGIDPDSIETDERGRIIVSLPDAEAMRSTEYRSDLESAGPGEMAEILASEEGDDGNDIERLMQEPPGGVQIHGGSRTKGPKKPRPPRGPNVGDHIIASSYHDPRNKTLSVKVSDDVYEVMYAQIDGPGVIIEEVGQALLAGMQLWQIKAFCAKCVREAQERVRADKVA